MIDPQIQANNWVKNKEKERNLVILKQNSSEKEIENKLYNAIEAGIPVLLENIAETVDTFYDFILQRKLIKSGASYRIKAGDK
jgi:dynein heavy chain